METGKSLMFTLRRIFGVINTIINASNSETTTYKHTSVTHFITHSIVNRTYNFQKWKNSAIGIVSSPSDGLECTYNLHIPKKETQENHTLIKWQQYCGQCECTENHFPMASQRLTLKMEFLIFQES